MSVKKKVTRRISGEIIEIIEISGSRPGMGQRDRFIDTVFWQKIERRGGDIFREIEGGDISFFRRFWGSGQDSGLVVGSMYLLLRVLEK